MQTIEVDRYINVVVSVLKKKKKILIATRPLNKNFPGLYEFPGGKLVKGEYLLEGLLREIDEELGVKINLNKTYFLKSYKIIQNETKLKLFFFLCLSWVGDPTGQENQILRWIYPSELRKHNLLKSNQRFVNYLLRNIFPATN